MNPRLAQRYVVPDPEHTRPTIDYENAGCCRRFGYFATYELRRIVSACRRVSAQSSEWCSSWHRWWRARLRSCGSRPGYALTLALFALVAILTAHQLWVQYQQRFPTDLNTDFYPPVSHYSSQMLDSGTPARLFHELEMRTGCIGAVDLGEPLHHLRLPDGRQLLNPVIQPPDTSTQTTSGWDVSALQEKVESWEVGSVCDFYHDQLEELSASGLTFEPGLDSRPRQRWNHVVVQYRQWPGLKMVTRSFFNDDAICIQHYDDYLQQRWPCRWGVQAHDEL